MIHHEQDEIMHLKFPSIQVEEIQTTQLYKVSGPSSISSSPSMDSKKDGLPPAVRPVLPPEQTDWTVQDTGMSKIASLYSLHIFMFIS